MKELTLPAFIIVSITAEEAVRNLMVGLRWLMLLMIHDTLKDRDFCETYADRRSSGKEEEVSPRQLFGLFA